MVPSWRRAPAGRAKREGKRIFPHPVSLPQGQESRGGSQEGKRHTTPLSTLSTARPLPRSRKLLQDRGPSRRVGRHTGKVPPSGETSPGGKHTCPRSEKERERSGGSGYSRVPDTRKQPGLKSQRGDSNEMTVEGWLALQVLRRGVSCSLRNRRRGPGAVQGARRAS